MAQKSKIFQVTQRSPRLLQVVSISDMAAWLEHLHDSNLKMHSIPAGSRTRDCFGSPFDVCRWSGNNVVGAGSC